MTKKVKARRWSVEKFTDAVKNAAKKAGVKFSPKATTKAYEDGSTVAYTVSKFATK